MPLTTSVIETGVDRLVNLVDEKGRVSSADAAKELGVSTTVVMEWAEFLEEEGVIKIEYRFTKPFLIARKLARKDVQEKAKELSGKKDVFIRKAEVSLSFLEKESEKLKSLKDEFDKIKKELGLDIDHVKDEMAELQKYEQLKIELDKRVEDQKNSSIGKLQEITEQITSEKRKYSSLLQEIKQEEENLAKDREASKSIEESEELIKKKVASLKALIKQVEERANQKEENIKNSEQHIRNLELLAKKTEERLEKEKEIIEPLIEQSVSQTGKVKELQDKIIEKISSKEKKLKGVKKASEKMKAFFQKKMGVLGLIEKVNKDRNDLEKELLELIKKEKSFQLS